MAYICVENNIHCTAHIIGVPQFQRNYRGSGKMLTSIYAVVSKGELDGYERFRVILNFWEGLAVGATGLRRGYVIVLDGRINSFTTVGKRTGKHGQEHVIEVDDWHMRDDDPLGVIEQLKAQREKRLKAEAEDD